MKLPAKVEYACNAAVELALRYDKNSPVQIRVIAKAQNIPKNFLLQLLIRLKNAGIVESNRGVSGGYFLVRSPSDIKLAEIVRAVDNTLLDATPHRRRQYTNDSSELFIHFWDDMNKEWSRRLERTTLEDLTRQLQNSEPMYVI